ncbi:hypothetical protein LINPERPRIM_LOCUS21265, partial [Linum perenne]
MQHRVLGRLLPVLSGDLSTLLTSFSSLASQKTPYGVVCRGAWGAVIAHLWKERCGRLHGALPKTVETLVWGILRELALFSLGSADFSTAISLS